MAVLNLKKMNAVVDFNVNSEVFLLTKILGLNYFWNYLDFLLLGLVASISS